MTMIITKQLSFLENLKVKIKHGVTMNKLNPEELGFSRKKLSAINNMCQEFIDKGQIAGVSAIIKRNGQTAYRENMGYADIESKTPIKDDTIFRIYSMSKPLTVVAALTLFEEGKFYLEDNIKDFIPSFKNQDIFLEYENGKLKTKKAEDDITIGQLLTMTSGLSYGFTDEGLDTYYNEKFEKSQKEGGEFNLEILVDQIASFPLGFEPGTDYRYSFSIDVIGRLIEVISGQKYSDFVKERILNPLGMTDTFLHVPDDKLHRFASMYEWKEGKLIKTSLAESEDFIKTPPFEMPGGGYLSTIDDYSTFCEMLLNRGFHLDKQIIGRKTLDLMSSNHLTGRAFETFSTEYKPGYGYGLGVRTMLDITKSGLNGSVGEWGWDGMASTWMCIDPVENLTAVFMIQLIPYDFFPVQSRFQKIMYSALI